MVANLPLRPGIIASSEVDLPKIKTFRDGIEWYKRTVRGISPFGDLTTQEQEYMDDSWVVIATHLADIQGIPKGVVSYMLAELAVTEMAMLDMAEEEGHSAIAEAHDEQPDSGSVSPPDDEPQDLTPIERIFHALEDDVSVPSETEG